jgi:hypothetical protein
LKIHMASRFAANPTGAEPLICVVPHRKGDSMKHSLLLAGMVALALTACGKKEAPPPPAAAPAPAPAAAPAPAPAQSGMTGMEGMSGMSGGPVMNGEKKEEPKK